MLLLQQSSSSIDVLPNIKPLVCLTPRGRRSTTPARRSVRARRRRRRRDVDAAPKCTTAWLNITNPPYPIRRSADLFETSSTSMRSKNSQAGSHTCDALAARCYREAGAAPATNRAGGEAAESGRRMSRMWSTKCPRPRSHDFGQDWAWFDFPPHVNFSFSRQIEKELKEKLGRCADEVLPHLRYLADR